jgi:phage gpG-like protein
MKELEKLMKTLKEDQLRVCVGILGSKSVRSDGAKTNAEIGAVHEFGGKKMPMRSFLRMPITLNLMKDLEGSENFNPSVLKKVMAEGSTKAWLEVIGAAAVGVILDAFDTGGFGKWKKSNMTRKKNHQTLVETQQLRDAIWYEVR